MTMDAMLIKMNHTLLQNLQNVCQQNEVLAMTFFGLDAAIVKMFKNASPMEIKKLAENSELPLGVLIQGNNITFWAQLFDNLRHPSKEQEGHIQMSIIQALGQNSSVAAQGKVVH